VHKGSYVFPAFCADTCWVAQVSGPDNIKYKAAFGITDGNKNGVGYSSISDKNWRGKPQYLGWKSGITI